MGGSMGAAGDGRYAVQPALSSAAQNGPGPATVLTSRRGPLCGQ